VQNVDFSDESLEVFKFLLLNRLDRKFLPGCPVLSQIDKAKPTTGQLLDEMIFVFDIRLDTCLKHLLICCLHVDRL